MAVFNLPPPAITSLSSVGTYLGSLIKSLQQFFNYSVQTNQPASRLMLQSSGGVIYFIIVNDDGTLEVQSADGLPKTL
jgi:hypothetical protein